MSLRMGSSVAFGVSRSQATGRFRNGANDRRAPAGPPESRRGLLDRVDPREDLVGADLGRVRRDHRINRLLHLVAVGERDSLELPRLLERIELGGVLARLDLPTVRTGLLARPDDRVLQVL